MYGFELEYLIRVERDLRLAQAARLEKLARAERRAPRGAWKWRLGEALVILGEKMKGNAVPAWKDAGLAWK